MIFMTISKSTQGYHVRVDDQHLHMIGYSKRNAIRQFRREYGLVGKHITVLEV